MSRNNISLKQKLLFSFLDKIFFNRLKGKVRKYNKRTKPYDKIGYKKSPFQFYISFSQNNSQLPIL